MKDIVIIGAGGFGREVAWLIERINNVKSTWNNLGFIDDNLSENENIYDDLKIVSNIDTLLDCKKEIYVVCAVGNSKTRKIIIDKLIKNSNIKFATLIDPAVIMSKSVKIDEGCIICAGSILTVDIKIKRHSIINLSCTVGHDVILNEFTTVYPNVNISGNVNIGICCELGTGTKLIQGKNVGDNTIVGANSCVIKDIPSNVVAVGSPTRIAKYL